MSDLVFQEPPADGQLVLIFDVHMKKKYGLVKPTVTRLVLRRNSPAHLSILTGHLESNLQLQSGEGRKLLLHAICDRAHVRVAGRLRELKKIVPLVCDQVWSLILLRYPYSPLKVLVEQNRPKAVRHRSSLFPCMAGLWRRELLLLNVGSYLPSKSLASDHVMDLCRDVFEKGMKIKPQLRKGVWLHLVGVYPPDMKTLEEREQYVNKLRRVYDSLRGKWIGQDNDDDVRHLLDAVRRDAVRTDPGHPFYEHSNAHYSSRINLCESPVDDNIQKLVNVITIYTLEHGTCAYTQGMTDILSPILYVMKHEADAYICFSAMVERIRNHFETWCLGTLLKLERLRHLCEVLDPELFYHLKENIEEDAFALFFGMVLIECRREFSFDDSFHLLEAIWAAVACMKDSLPRTTTRTHTEWAHYMTQSSANVIQQVMGESECPYSAEPLPMSESGIDIWSRSRQASVLSQGSVGPHEHFRTSMSAYASAGRMISHNEAINEEEGERERSSNAETSSLTEQSVVDVNVERRPRSFTDPSLKCSNPSLAQGEPSSKKKGLSDSHSESEIMDSYTGQPPPSNQKSSGSSRAVTEMSDMSSLSSNNALANSFKSFDGKSPAVKRAGSAGSDRSRSPIGKMVVNGHRSPSPVEEVDDSCAESPNLTVNGGGVTLGAPLCNGGLHLLESEASTLKSLDMQNSPIKEHASRNGMLPVLSDATDLSSDYQSALSMLSNGHHGNNSSSPSQPSSSEIYQTANEDSSGSMTDLQSRSPSLTPAFALLKDDDHHNPTPSADTVLADHQSNDEDITPVHVRPLPNGTIVQGTEEHQGAEVPVRHLRPASTAMATGSDSQPHKEEQPRAKPITIKAKGSGRNRSKTEPQRNSPVDFYDGSAFSGSSRVTPVNFFDAMQQLATSVPASVHSFLQSGQLGQRSLVGREEEQEPENELELSQANSMILSQLITTDRSAPQVTREKSLELPVSDCFPLFICLSILVQHRAEIMRRNIDFVGLSVLLNTQAGIQDLDATLDVARNLYKTYREYQMTFLGSKPEDLDTWLDDDRITDDEAMGRQQDHLESGEVNNRTSPASDDVFTP